MNTTIKAGLLACALTLSTAMPAHAQHENHAPASAELNIGNMDQPMTCHASGSHAHRAAPISVMRDHMHSPGKWMASYRYMHMSMNGLRDGTDDISPEQAVTNYANPNAPPATFRVAPTAMDMDMHMLGVMYGVTDWLTLMSMGSYIEKEMKSITFQGMMGTTRLGTNTVKSSGWGDTNLTGLIRLYEGGGHHVHLQAGISAPTGSIKETGTMLTPMNMRMNMRLAYGMQLGSGTWDAMPGITYTGQTGNWGWGAQYVAVLRMEDENDRGYRLGDKHTLTAWGTYAFKPELEFHTRLQADHIGKIKGSDPLITSPMTGSDPENYGGRYLDGSVGFTYKPEILGKRNNRFGVDVSAPLYQDLNGPQLKRDYALTIGWGHSF